MTYLYSRTMLFGQALKRVQGTHAGVQGVHFQGYMYHRSAPENPYNQPKKCNGDAKTWNVSQNGSSAVGFFRVHWWTYRGTYGTQ